MTPQEFAALLNGREYGDEITREEEAMAKAHGLVVVFGYSDDNFEKQMVNSRSPSRWRNQNT